MPFTAACPFCPTKVKVPDHLLGVSLRCPRCGDYFTVAPEELASTKGHRPPSPAAAQPPAPALSVPRSAPAVDFSSPSLPSSDADDSSAGWVSPWGGFAFVLAGAAWLLAALALPRYAVMPLAGIGLIVSLAGILSARENWRPRDSVWLAVGGGGNLLLLLVGLILPSWLNNRWGRDFNVPEPDRNIQILVSHDGRNVSKDLSPGEWVEADKNAILQGGDVLIRIDSATVDRLPEKEQAALLIHLHLENVGMLRDLSYRGQGSNEQPAIARDSRGQELSRQPPSALAKKVGQIESASVTPLHGVNDLLVFDPPWPGTEYVELELPAAAWGRTGNCQFRIPKHFITYKSRSK